MEISSILLLTEEDKSYWISKAYQIPASLVKYFYCFLNGQNEQVGWCIKKAIDQSLELVNKMNAKSTKIKQTFAKLRGAGDEKAAEVLFEEQLNK